MAATITKTGNFISITGIDADVAFSSIGIGESEDMRVHSISFKAGSGADIIAIREGTTSGAKIMFEKLTATLATTLYLHGQHCHPCIKYADCTLSTGHEVIIRLV